MARAKDWWRGKLPDIGAALVRFPIPIAIAASLTLYILMFRGTDLEERITTGLSAAFLFAVAAAFYAESTNRSLLTRLALALVGIAVIALLVTFQWQVWLSPYFLIAGLVLTVGVAGFLQRSERNAAFWSFNHRLWRGAVLAFVGAIILGAGLSAIVSALRTLFGLPLPTRLYEDIWTVAGGFVAPVGALAFAPRLAESTAGLEEEFTARAVGVLARFVLVPLILVYTAILYAYAVKIGLQHALPQGVVGSMVVGYLLTGTITLMLAYPVRETGGVLMRLFWRFWMWLALLPVGLLFIAVGERIYAYGLTENRYLMALIGVWALALAVLRIVRRGEFDLRLAPGLLALLLLFGAGGPWGAIGRSVHSQFAQLGSLLTEKGILVSGKVVPVAKHPTATAPGKPDGGNAMTLVQSSRLRLIEFYLNQHHALGLMRPWFKGVDPDPFVPGKRPEQTAAEVGAALGLSVNIGTGATPTSYYYANAPKAFAVAGGIVAGPFILNMAGPPGGVLPSQSVDTDDIGNLDLTLDEATLKVHAERAGDIDFDLFAAASASAPLNKLGGRTPLSVTGTGRGLAGTMLIENLSGPYRAPNSVRFWLILRKAP